MRKSVIVLLVFSVVVCLFGCSKKKETLEEIQVPVSSELLNTINTENKASETIAEVTTKPEAISPSETQAALPLPPGGPYKPTGEEIQTALKNAGFYTGAIDGKIGPLSKKAITEFQKANGLTADGKVGPRTWEALGKHLNSDFTVSNAIR